mmetsp:Transcript_25009/g.53969  ORF Transcript_25009/g.53969 Transcript_25009/m.53969 type:complete len:87 (+) Transcript_25009:2888-3148(+)
MGSSPTNRSLQAKFKGLVWHLRKEIRRRNVRAMLANPTQQIPERATGIKDPTKGVPTADISHRRLESTSNTQTQGLVLETSTVPAL